MAGEEVEELAAVVLQLERVREVDSGGGVGDQWQNSRIGLGPPFPWLGLALRRRDHSRDHSRRRPYAQLS